MWRIFLRGLMSKPVRIRSDVAARVDVLAASERRSFANMVEVLLLQSLGGAVLTERGEVLRGNEPTPVGSAPTGGSVDLPRSVSAVSVPPAVHDVPVERLPDSGCGFDTPRGTKCKLCGKVH